MDSGILSPSVCLSHQRPPLFPWPRHPTPPQSVNLLHYRHFHTDRLSSPLANFLGLLTLTHWLPTSQDFPGLGGEWGQLLHPGFSVPKWLPRLHLTLKCISCVDFPAAQLGGPQAFGPFTLPSEQPPATPTGVGAGRPLPTGAEVAAATVRVTQTSPQEARKDKKKKGNRNLQIQKFLFLGVGIQPPWLARAAPRKPPSASEAGPREPVHVCVRARGGWRLPGAALRRLLEVATP